MHGLEAATLLCTSIQQKFLRQQYMLCCDAHSVSCRCFSRMLRSLAVPLAVRFFSSFQALLSSGRSSSETSSPATFGMAASSGGGLSAGHLPTLPMAVLPQSLAEEASRISGLEADRRAPGKVRSVADPSSKLYENVIGSGEDGLAGRQEQASSATVDDGGVAEIMLADGVLEVLAGVIAPCRSRAEEAGGGVRAAGPLTPPAAEESSEVFDDDGLRLEALEAAVLMLEGRPPAQAEFETLGGHARISRLLHDMAARSKHSVTCPPGTPSGDSAAARSRSRSRSRADSLPQAEGQSAPGEFRSLDAAFDALFRLALDGHAVAPGARADGVDTVKMLLMLAARSPSPPVALRAARSLQALLRIRPMNAVSLQRQNALRVVADAVANLAFSGSSGEVCTGAGPGRVVADEEYFSKGEVVAERRSWSVDDKREALSSLNDVVRAMAAVYSRQDARALERYVSILLSSSTDGFGVGGASGKPVGMQCSSCRATPTGAAGSTAAAAAVRRCLLEGCKGVAGLCGTCDEALHERADGDSHVRVPFAASSTREKRYGSRQGDASRHRGEDPAWAVEAGKALMKAMTVMLDDRESYGLPPTPDRKSGTRRHSSAAEQPAPAESSKKNNTSILAGMLQIVQDELLGPLGAHRDEKTSSGRDTETSDGQSAAATGPPATAKKGGDARALSSSSGRAAKSASGDSGWTGGWLLGALEIVARVVVRGDSATVREVETAGGLGLLAHITSLPSPPPHLSAAAAAVRRPFSAAAGAGGVSVGADHRGRYEGGVGGQTPTDAGSESERGGGECRSDQDQLSEAWVGWIGARRLSLWVIREALLTGTAGHCGSSSSSNSGVGTTAILDQPARWLVWLVRALAKAPLPCEDHPARACCTSQVSC